MKTLLMAALILVGWGCETKKSGKGNADPVNTLVCTDGQGKVNFRYTTPHRVWVTDGGCLRPKYTQIKVCGQCYTWPSDNIPELTPQEGDQ